MMHLWNRQPLKVYGGRMSESMLAILCHVIKGEPLVRVSSMTALNLEPIDAYMY